MLVIMAKEGRAMRMGVGLVERQSFTQVLLLGW